MLPSVVVAIHSAEIFFFYNVKKLFLIDKGKMIKEGIINAYRLM